ETANAEQGAVAGRIASTLGVLISYIALLVFDLRIMPITIPASVLSSARGDTVGWMLVLLLPAGVAAIIAGSFIGWVGGEIGWVGGEIGWTVAEYSRFRAPACPTEIAAQNNDAHH